MLAVLRCSSRREAEEDALSSSAAKRSKRGGAGKHGPTFRRHARATTTISKPLIAVPVMRVLPSAVLAFRKSAEHVKQPYYRIPGRRKKRKGRSKHDDYILYLIGKMSLATYIARWGPP